MANGRMRRAYGACGLFGIIVFGVVMTLAGAMPSSPAHAATDLPDSENGRYAFHAAADGVLRLDRTRGEVSTCTRQTAGWACYLVADERAALESEIARLAAENGRLKEALLANRLPLPGAKGAGTSPGEAKSGAARDLADAGKDIGRGQDAGKGQNKASRPDDYSIEISGPGIDKIKAFAQQAWKRISSAFGPSR